MNPIITACVQLYRDLHTMDYTPATNKFYKAALNPDYWERGYVTNLKYLRELEQGICNLYVWHLLQTNFNSCEVKE